MEEKITELEDYQPIINERLAMNELAIESLVDKYRPQASVDIDQQAQKLQKLEHNCQELLSHQLSGTRVRVMVEDAHDELIEVFSTIERRFELILEKSNRAYSLRTDFNQKPQAIETRID